jgi:hypothetical protein
MRTSTAPEMQPKQNRGDREERQIEKQGVIDGEPHHVLNARPLFRYLSQNGEEIMDRDSRRDHANL